VFSGYFLRILSAKTTVFYKYCCFRLITGNCYEITATLELFCTNASPKSSFVYKVYGTPILVRGTPFVLTFNCSKMPFYTPSLLPKYNKIKPISSGKKAEKRQKNALKTMHLLLSK
jgi:hypothetical protein